MLLLRNVSDINHDYYDLIDSVMNVMMSFCEGGKGNILDAISEVIPAERIYDRMQVLIKLLYHRTRPYFEEERTKLTQQIKEMPFTDVQDLLKGREQEAVLIDEVNKKLIDTVKIKGFLKLKSIYIKDKNFSQHFCLKIASKIFFLMQNISQTSELYKKLLQEMKDSIKLKQRSAFRSEIELDQDQIVHKFISTVTSSVEIVNRENQLVISQFLKTPSSFFLSVSSKEDFFDNIQIDTIPQV